MADCHKCGAGKLRKQRDGRRKCKRCGFLPGRKLLDRSGENFLGSVGENCLKRVACQGDALRTNAQARI